MAAGVLTLLTDFGTSDAYVAAMKGVILSRAPDLRIVDITHQIPPQDIRRAAFVLAEAAPWYPPGTVHVVVVDPGVGTARRAITAQLGPPDRAQIVVAPDNGVITHLADRMGGCRAFELAQPGLGLARRSATFHGRDLFSPAGAALAAGLVTPGGCGPEVEPVLLDLPRPAVGPNAAAGAVIAVDHFGNLITNLRAERLPARGLNVTIVGRPVAAFVRTYGEAADGAVVSLFGSGGWLEVAQVQGSAAALLDLSVGAAVDVQW